MKRNLFISIFLSMCIVLGTVSPVFTETVNAQTDAASSLYKEAALVDLTKETTADNTFALRNGHTNGYFNTSTKEQAFATSTEITYGGKGVSVVWDKMDDYGLWAHTAQPYASGDDRAETSTLEKNQSSPTNGAYSISEPTGGQWKAADSRSPRRNKIQLNKKPNPAIDTSQYSHVNLVIYSSKVTKDLVRLSLLNNTTSVKSNMDFTLDWAGEWRTISFPLNSLSSSVNNFMLENRGEKNGFQRPADNENIVYIAKVYLSNVAPRLDVVDLTALANSWNGNGEFAFANNYHTNGYFNSKTVSQAWEYTDSVKYKNNGYSLVWDKMNDYGLYQHTGSSGILDDSSIAEASATRPQEAGSYVNSSGAISGDNWVPINDKGVYKWAVRSARRNAVHLSPHRYCNDYYNKADGGQINGKGKDFELENYKYINLVLYSEKRTDEKIRLSLINSETSNSHNVKFTYTFNLNWEDGWKIVSIPVAQLEPTNEKYDVYTAETEDNSPTDANNTVTRFALENRGIYDKDFPQVDNENKVYLSQVYMSNELGDGIDVFVDDKIDVSVSSSQYTVADGKIHGYGGMKVSELKSATTVGQDVIFDVYNSNGTKADGNALCTAGMYIESRTESGSQSKKYVLDVSDYKIHDIEYRVNDTVLTGNFTTGSIKAWVNIDAYKSMDAALIIAYYKGDTLSKLGYNESKNIKGVAQKLETTLDGIDETAGAKVKIMLFDNMTSITPLKKSIELTPLAEGDMSSVLKVYPNYSQKAITFSYDDGPSSDETLINDYLNEYGLKATFNIRTDILSSLTADEFNDRYRGHEVANHTATHPRWATYGDEPYIANAADALSDFGAAQNAIHSYTGEYPKGGAWSYSAPESQSYYTETIGGLQKMGFEYMRDTGETGNFDIPIDWMNIQTTCHHDNMETYIESFKTLDTRGELKMFYVWGHSWEFVPGNTGTVKWDGLDALLSPFADREAYWAATNIELCRYLKAMDNAVIDHDNYTIYNPSENVTLHFTAAGKQIAVAPGETAQIFQKK